MRRPIALLTGVALDAALGDPPNAAHPVAWLGHVAAALDGRAPRTRVAGAFATAAVVGGAAAASMLLQRRVGSLPAGGMLTWVATSRRSLLARAAEIADALEAGRLEEARWLLGRHLVSRPTADLDASEVAGATIESLAENLSDGVVAPWLWFVLAGAPGAAGYRALNTLDGMWGYRTPRYAEFGWAAARADDVANLLPARLTALALIAAAGQDASGALATWREDRHRTASPNAGHPMAAMAGALGVVLRKRGEYALNDGAREPVAADIRRALALVDRAAWLTLAALALAGSRR